MALVFLCFAAAIMALVGVASTSYAVTLVLAAAVLAGGTYALIYFGALAVHIGKRVWKRQPIIEIED